MTSTVRGGDFPARLGSPLGLAWGLLVVVALVDLVSGLDGALADLFTACPCLAAAGGARRQVAAVGAAALALATAITARGDLGSEDFGIAVAGIVIATAVALLVAARRIAAEERAAWLVSIVEQSRTATLSVDLDRKVTAWNNEAGRLLGASAPRALGYDVHEVLPRSVSAEVDAILERGREGTPTDEYASTWRHGDDASTPVVVSGFPLRNPAGTVVAVAVTASDRSEVEEVEAERDRLARRVAQSERLDSLGQLAGGIAHDFNNLLTIVLAYCHLASRRTDDPALRADLDKISDVSHRAAALSRKLLTFSSAAPTGNEVAQVNRVFASLNDLLARTLPTNVSLSAHLDDDLWAVPLDASMVEQMLMNLVINARDALPDGGRITVETANEVVNGHVTTAPPTLPPGRYVRIAVSDDGTGMPEEVRERAFEPLFTTKPRGEGTGFGLATVYGICRQAGGVASIYSEPGQGTTVRMFLPAADDRAPALDLSSPQPVPAVPEGRLILLVEDSELLRQPLEEKLVDAGYTVVAAPSAEEALTVLGDRRVDLLVSDVMMPGLSGAQLAEQLRERDATMPVLLISGYTARTVGVLPTDGSYEFLEKPFNLDDFMVKVSQALRPPLD